MTWDIYALALLVGLAGASWLVVAVQLIVMFGAPGPLDEPEDSEEDRWI